MADTHKPVIFLAFANDRDDTVGYLRNLPVEARRLREVLESAEKAGLCEVVVRSNSTAGDIFKVFQDPRYRNRVAIFHYGGHANGYQLLLESAAGQSAAADAGGLAKFLGQQQGLQLVFLNGCSTQQQTEGLLEANISAVISTSRAIEDQVATDFSFHFYQGLAGGATIRTAFHEAAASVQTEHGGNTRSLYFGGKDAAMGQSETDRWPWNLNLREGSESADQWNLPDAVNDPLFGLPPLPEQDLPESPFRYLNWFTKKEAEVFYGRGHQIRELYDRLTAPRTAPIMLFYGQSGVGKSSVLDAGLLPRLEQNYEVRYLRRSEAGLLNTLQMAFLPEAVGVPIETAWQAKEEKLQKPLIVFLDQVEEVYTRPLADQSDELGRFLKAVKDIFCDANVRPQGKLVLSFRKEWLAELEGQLVASELPRTKVFLEPVDRRGIIEIVRGPTHSARLHEHYGLTVEDGLAEIIADDLLADRDSAIAPTLQILLTKMWAKATEADYEHPLFSQELYLQLKRDGILLRDFLNQQIAAFRQRYPEAVDSGLLLDIVALHTTPLGTANEWSVEQLQQQYSHLGTALSAILQQCQDLHLLTVATSSHKENTKTTRLAHDTLGPLVREQFEVSDKPGQRARRILDNRSVDFIGDRVGAGLDEADLKLVEQGVNGTRALTATEVRLLNVSRELRTKLQRTRKFLKLAGAAAITLIIVAAVIATISRNEAVKQRAEAITAQQKADDALVTGKMAVDEMLQGLASEGLKNVPQIEGLREKFLDKATGFYSDFEKQDPGDPRWKKQIALAEMRIGDMHRAMGNYDTANKAYEVSTQEFEELKHKYPDEPEYQQGLANSFNWWGELWREQKEDGEAKSRYEAALVLQEQLVINFSSHENHATYWLELARTHNNLGLLHKNANRADEAYSAFTLVIAMLKPDGQESVSTQDLGPYLSALYPKKYGEGEVPFARYVADLKLELKSIPRPKSIQKVLGWSYNNRAIVLKYQEKLEKAEADYENANGQWESLLEDEPDEREYMLERGKVQNNLANLLRVSSPAKALDHNEKGVEIFEQLAAPVPSIRSELANSYNSRGAILWTMSREKGTNKDELLSDAAGQYRQAIAHYKKLFEENPKEIYIAQLSECICNLATLKLALKVGTVTLKSESLPTLDDHDLSRARHIESAKEMEILDQFDISDAARYQKAAWIMSRCILLAQADQNLSDDEQRQVADKYTDRTLKLLQLAIDKGLAKETIVSDPRYEPLRKLRPQALVDIKPSSVLVK